MLRVTVLGLALLISLVGPQVPIADSSVKDDAERGGATLENPYCVAKATPSTAPPQPVVPVCLATISELVSVLTGGVLTSWTGDLRDPAEIEFMNAMSAGTYIIGIDYTHTDYGDPRLYWTTDNPSGCTQGASFQASEYDYWWNDGTASAGSFLGCDVFYHYEDTFYGGAIYDCSPCPDMEYMRHKASSASWHP